MHAKCLFTALAAMSTAAVAPSAVAAETTPVFGPAKYTRAAGHPRTFTDTFQHGGSAQCQLVVINGNDDGTNRITSASIFLNGVRILGPSAFKRSVGRIVEPVALADHNELRIRLASKPGSFVIVSVECDASQNVEAADGRVHRSSGCPHGLGQPPRAAPGTKSSGPGTTATARCASCVWPRARTPTLGATRGRILG